MKKLLVLAILFFFVVVSPCMAHLCRDGVSVDTKIDLIFSEMGENNEKVRQLASRIEAIASELKQIKANSNQTASRAEQISNGENQKDSQFIEVNGKVINKQCVATIYVDYCPKDVFDRSEYYWIRVSLINMPNWEFNRLSVGNYKTKEEADKEKERLVKEWGLLK